MDGVRRPFVASFVACWVTLVALLTGLALPAGATARPARTLDDTGSILGAPAESRVRSLAPTQGCQVLLDSGDGDCAVVRTATGDLVVTVEAGPKIDEVLAERPWTVRVYRPSTAIPDGWEVALSTHGDGTDPGPLYAQVTAKVADVTGDGHDELIVGYRRDGTGQILDYDVVGADADGSPRVLAHDEVYKGNVRTRHGRLTTYEPVYRRNDANCCPTWIQRDDIVYRDGAFRGRKVWKVPTKQADVPPSDIG
jgi:hypothetical protein